jgi:hypothetical protein
VQGMHLPDNVEKAWKDVEHDLSENPLSKGVDSLQKLTDPSVRAVCCQCDCLFATTCKVCPPDAKDDTMVCHLRQSWITDYLKGNLPQVGLCRCPLCTCRVMHLLLPRRATLQLMQPVPCRRPCERPSRVQSSMKVSPDSSSKRLGLACFAGALHSLHRPGGQVRPQIWSDGLQ